ncbi:MAG TPA: hypothetical protein VFS07_08225 [Gemmatimonadales bacterium]|jgi:hypothetical protein|nr:hypothetical protein [Gemmatimonadales bacterium]
MATDDPLDPLALLKLVVSGLLLLATLVALVLGLTGIEPRALALAAGCWGMYGVARGVVSGVLAPSVEWLGDVLGNGGFDRPDPSHGDIETLAVQGRYAEAAERWFRVAAESSRPAAPMLRRAALLAGPMGDPGTAAAELTQFRDTARGGLRPAEDVAVGLALVDLYETRLHDAAGAMREIRRLLDRHPDTRQGRRLRAALADLKRQRFGDAYVPAPAGAPLPEP